MKGAAAGEGGGCRTLIHSFELIHLTYSITTKRGSRRQKTNKVLMVLKADGLVWAGVMEKIEKSDAGIGCNRAGVVGTGR